MFKDVEHLAATCDERTAYFIIDECGAFIWRMNHDMADGRIPIEHHAAIDADIVTAREDQMILVKALPRFGVKPLDENDRPTPEYWAWYRWWDAWKRGMDNDAWRACDAAMTRGLTPEEEKQYRPAGSWRDSLAPVHV